MLGGVEKLTFRFLVGILNAEENKWNKGCN